MTCKKFYFHPSDKLIEPQISKNIWQFEAVRDMFNGEIKGYKQTINMEMTKSASESLSLERQPSDQKDFVRGSSSNMLFKPGGFEKTKTLDEKPKKERDPLEDFKKVEKMDLSTVPHGFTRGLSKEKIGKLDFDRENSEVIIKNPIEKKIEKKKEIIRLDNSFFEESEILLDEEVVEEKQVKEEKVEKKRDEIEELLLEFSNEKGVKKGKEYAIMERTDTTNFYKEVPNMAIQYPFDLDVFQKEAILHLEKRENVFVAAHTSSGKTVVAEYAVALSKKHLTRAIYTSPIKTLSNQKYREFKKTFDDVGILTGDVQINPTATCLIMTTEILRSMLYKGADLIRDVEWVIFDEVHYINDAERGVVWEEVIIMLPEHIGLIFLSATIPNTYEFADWIGRTKKKELYVISTLKRPVPLEFHLYFNGDLYKIVDNQGQFLNMGYRSAIQAVKDKFKKSKKIGDQNSEWVNVIDIMKKKKLLPFIVFCFSRKKCEEIGFGLSKCDLTTSSEKNEIHVFYQNSISKLTKEDRGLPQVLKMKDLLERGIGVHHSGLLPIVKEIVEMLFSRGLLKVLFATETFAMGVNMPAKCVVYNGLRKHDGKNFRDLLSGEFIQMSGRAGRRGIDTVGMVIMLCWDEIPEEILLQKLILGKANKLESQFRLTYNMILNLLRVEDFRVEDMIKRSFSESKTQRLLPNSIEVYEKAKKKVEEIEDLDCIYEDSRLIENYYKTSQELEKTIPVYQKSLLESKLYTTIFTAGRVVIVKTQKYGNTLGVILKQNKDIFTVQILKLRNTTILPFPKFNALIIDKGMDTIDTADIITVTDKKLKIDNTVESSLISLWEGNQLTELTPKELKITSLEVVESFTKKQKLINSMMSSKCNGCAKFDEHYAVVDKKNKLVSKINTIKYALSDDNLELMPEYTKRINVLQHLKYIDFDNTVQLKGRVACEINSCDELMVTEMIFENFFTNLRPEECVSVLSTLICQDKSEIEYSLPENLLKSKEKIEKLATTLGELQLDYGLDTSGTEYAGLLKFDLMEVSYEWAKGVSFQEIMKMTTILEGSIVRSITQIDQACREVRNAARVIGDSALYKKMEEASSLIKRDIVFAASLYVV